MFEAQEQIMQCNSTFLYSDLRFTHFSWNFSCFICYSFFCCCCCCCYSIHLRRLPPTWPVFHSFAQRQTRSIKKVFYFLYQQSQQSYILLITLPKIHFLRYKPQSPLSSHFLFAKVEKVSLLSFVRVLRVVEHWPLLFFDFSNCELNEMNLGDLLLILNVESASLYQLQLHSHDS